MKTAYELAMERLAKSEPPLKLSDEQKRQLAEVDSVYAAKIAERELFIKGQLAEAAARTDLEAMEQLEQQMINSRKSLQAEREEKKEQIRKAAAQ